MDFEIKELTKENLEETIRLIENIFTLNIDDKDHPRKWIPASLEPKTKKSKALYKTTGCAEIKQFVAIKNKKVIGVTGYFTFKKDSTEADWLAWFAVEKSQRQKGVGTKLLQFAIDSARKHNKKYLRLYTSESKEERGAQKLYDRFCIKIVKKEKSPYQKGSMITYRELTL